MPDDENKEIAEQEAEEKEAEGLFDDDENGKKPDKDGKSDDAGDSPGGDSGDEDDEGDGDGDDKDKEEPTPKQIAEKRAGIESKDDKGDGENKSNNPLLSFLNEEPASDDDDDPKEPEAKGEPEDKKPDLLISDDPDFDLDEYKEQYPDDYNAIFKIATAIAEKMTDQQSGDTEYVSREELAAMEMRLEVANKHPDAEKITSLDADGNLVDSDFAEWLNDQPKAIQRLFVMDGTKNIIDGAEDFIIGLDYYKSTLTDRQAEKFDDKARASKKEKDDLHSHSMRTKKPGRKRGPKPLEDQEAEAEALFEKE